MGAALPREHAKLSRQFCPHHTRFRINAHLLRHPSVCPWLAARERPMVTRSRSLIIFTSVLVVTIWVWGLSGVLFWIRWNSFDRLGPPTKELFPYGEIRIGVDASY